MPTTNRKGVTLIELIIVMVIIAIGALLISPSFGKWVSHYRLKTATRDIVSMLRVAQMRAVSNNIQYRVNFDSGEIGATNSYLLQYLTTGGAWARDGATQTLPTGVVYNGITFPANHAEFNPNSSSSTGTITVQNSAGMQKSIMVASTGRIRIAE